jgi:hypothetical protein
VHQREEPESADDGMQKIEFDPHQAIATTDAQKRTTKPTARSEALFMLFPELMPEPMKRLRRDAVVHLEHDFARRLVGATPKGLHSITAVIVNRTGIGQHDEQEKNANHQTPRLIHENGPSAGNGRP